MLSKFAIKTQLYIGFTLILLLTIISTYITYDALNKTAAGFDDYRDMARDANLMSHIESSLLLTRTSAKDYFIRSHKDDIALFDSHYNQMRSYLDDAKKEIKGAGNLRDINALEMSIKNYFKGFKQVVYYTNQKSQQVNELLEINGPEIELGLSDLLVDIYAMKANQQSFKFAKEVSFSTEYFLSGQFYTLQFFHSHQIKDFQAAKAQFVKVATILKEHTPFIDEPDLNKLYLRLVDDIKHYEASLDEIYKLSVSRTRSIYLLDEGGPEMAKLTQELKQNIIAIQEQLGPAQVQANKTSFSLIMTMLLVLISATIIISVSIPRQIMGGLNRLKDGVGSFLVFLNKEALDVELIEIEGNNEFSDIASALNENILVTKEKLRQTQEQEEEQRKKLETQAITDGLTQLYNRRYFDDIAKTLYNDAKRHKHDFLIFILDIDNFKLYNDSYGHSAGDDALIKVAQAFKDYMARTSDLVFRLGGEEFGGVMTSQAESINNDLEYLNHLTKNIELLHIPHAQNTASDYVTVSIGLRRLSFDDDNTVSLEQAYQDADKALYLAKQQGRNKVCVFGDAP